MTSTLYIDKRHLKMRMAGTNALEIFDEQDKKMTTLPLKMISRVILCSNCLIESRLLARFGELGITTTLLYGKKHEPTYLLSTPHNDTERRLRQYRSATSASFCLKIGQDLISRKIASQQEMLNTLSTPAPAKPILEQSTKRLEELSKAAFTAPTMDKLRGFEGASSRHYFAAIAAAAPLSWHFTQRNRRPPLDPLNALFSLTATMLVAEATTLLYSRGLDPYIGFLHQPDFGRCSLACDIIEPLRAEAERFSICLLRTDLRPDHFSTDAQGCRLGKVGRSIYYPAWEKICDTLRERLAAEADQIIEQCKETLS